MRGQLRPRTRPLRLLPLALAIPMLAGIVGAPPVLAAPPDLRVVTDATYEVRPADGVVHVSARGTATSYAADSNGNRYYFPSMRLVIFAGATGISATASGAAAKVIVVETDDYQQLIEVALNRDLFYRQSTTFRLDYDLPTGASGGEVRVGANVARFPVWAVGSYETPGSSVALSLPRGFQLDLQGEPLPDAEPRDDGGHVYRWDAIADPDSFWLFATADQATITEDTYRDYTSRVQVPGQRIEVVVRAWADDPEWGTRTSERMTEALPLLGELIGVPYFGTARLVVVETVSRSLNGYAGIFDSSQAQDQIQVSFDADDTVTLHEAAHAWFNTSLSSDRWLLEGFASYYGGQAARELGIPPETFELTDELRAVAFPLGEWGDVGSESQDREQFAYGASLAAANEIADRAGTDGLITVFSAMAADEAAYQPVQSDRVDVSYSHTSNWHYLLDLLEERTGEGFGDIMREWIVSPADRHLLDDRTHARAAYIHLLSRLDGWEVPEPLRRQMNAWSFAAAEASVKDADAVLDERAALTERGAELDLALSLDGVREAFEDDGMDRAASLEQQIGSTLNAYAAALEASRDEVDLVESIGLIGSDPGSDLAASADAIDDGDWEAATSAANAALATWGAAAGEGTTRLAIGGGGVVVVVGVGTGLLLLRRRRSRVRGIDQGSDRAVSDI